MTKTKKEDLRKVPTRNYMILVTIFLITFLFVYYLYRFYVVYSNYQKETPILRDILPEITDQELEHYVQEAPTTVIYLCTASNDICRKFEKSFKKLIEKKNLKTYITYVNLSNTDFDTFTKKFNDQYQDKQKLNNYYPALVVFEDNKIRDIIQNSKKYQLTITDTEQFLKRNRIGD
ncbi:MAG: hypothetical protein HFJ12_06170 [Bacilli bacterium]|nr:hypothetical protein [Bacilli bacterium]